jgi:hypothetical protein
MLLFTFPSWLIQQSVWIAVGVGALLIAWAVFNLVANKSALSLQSAREPGIFTGLLWLIFVLYEQQMLSLPDIATGFRLDLIVLVPVLYILTAFAVWTLWAQTRKWWASRT